MPNVSLIKFLTLIRICLWVTVLFLCLLTRTLFIVQTWSQRLVFLLILNLIVSLLNFFIFNHRGYYQVLKRILVILLPLLTICTLIIYILYMFNIYYRSMNLLILNIMTNDRNESLLSKSFNYYKCCRIQDEILFDSVNERDYFLLFSYCKNTIEENEYRKDRWENIKSCGPILRYIIWNIRIVFLIDLLLNISIMIVSLIYIWEENDEWVDDKQCTLLITDNINYKIK